MAFFTWDQKYVLGVADIDGQHQRLVAMMEELHEAMRAGKGADILDKIIMKLRTYTMTHFLAEEKRMQEVNYPDYAHHKNQHQEFISKITEFQRHRAENKVGLSMNVMNFLKEWLVNHIMGTDKKYVPYFNEVSVG